MNDTFNNSTDGDGYPVIDPVKRRKSRIKLLLIIAIFAIPLILATVYLKVVRVSGAQLGDSSQGQLIRPAVPLTEFTLQSTDDVFDLESMYGIWTFLYMPDGECQDTCKLNLYHMRQVRLSLNQRMDRVQRVVLAQTADQLFPALLTEHPGLTVARGSVEEQALLRDQIHAAEGEMDALQDAIYVIDPFGNVMMRFPADLPPKSMLKDIKHLLKVSRIG